MIELKYSDVQLIDVNQITSEDDNPRTIIDENSIKELADTIKKVGLLQPIAVYYHNSQYHLIFGKRRLMAVRFNKMDKVPARVLGNKITDEVISIIKDIQLIENGQRKDVHPLEEAYAFSQSQHNTSELAQRIGKSKVYVQNRINLLRLCDEVREYFLKDIVTVSHALLLCKLTEEYQKLVLKNLLKVTGQGEEKKVVGILSIAQTINTISRLATVHLKEANFDLNDKTLCKDAGSCIKCQKRSGYNKTLFNDVEDGDICYDATCFNEKAFNHAKTIEQDLQEKGFNVVRITALYDTGKKELTEKQLEPDYLFYRNDFSLAKQNDLVGVYFEHHKKNQIGVPFALYSRTNDVQQEIVKNTKERKKTNIETIKYEKAKQAASNAVLQMLGLKLGAYHCESIPMPILKLIAYTYYNNLTKEHRENIDSFYEYENSNNINVAFEAITNKMTSQQMIQFLLMCITYEYVKNSTDAYELKYIKELCIEWKIDVGQILEKVDKEFSIKIDIFK